MSAITKRTVKPYIEVVDLYPGFKLEEECFSSAIIKDPDEPSRKKNKKKSESEGPQSWPHQKTTKQRSYENFLEEVVNERTGEFYPQKDEDGRAVPKTGLSLYITDIIRIRRSDGSEFLYTKGRADASIVWAIQLTILYQNLKFGPAQSSTTRQNLTTRQKN